MGPNDGHEIARIDSKAAAAIASKVEDYDALIHDAAEATKAQEDMSLREAIKAYPNAIIFSVILSLCVVMEGYDIILLGNFFAQPAFTKRYGECKPDGTCEIPATWQTGLQNATLVGCLIGLQFTGWASERLGYRKTILCALAAITAFVFIPFYAPSLPVLLVGQILQGLPWGVFQSITTAYAADITPPRLRPILTTWVNGCWVLGQVVSSGVMRATVNIDSHWAYKIPFAIQWVWPVPIAIGCFLAPESPWWLVRQGRLDEAKHVIRRLAAKGRVSDHEAEQTVKMMVYTNELEQAAAAGGGSYWECFKGTDRRRTEIAAMVYMIQIWCGGAIMGLSSYFYLKAGLPTDQAFNLTIGGYAMALCGTVIAWVMLQKLGRRTIYLYGQVVLFCFMLTAGCLAFKQDSQAFSWAIGSMLMIFTFIYGTTIGPVCFCIISEVGSTRLRAKTVVLARNFYNVAFILANVLNPRFLNTTGWNLGAKACLFWAGTGLVCLVWSFFRLPETRGRSFGALDILFENKVPARKFATTDVDEFASHVQAGAQHTEIIAEKDGSIDKVERIATNTADLGYKY